MSRTRTGSPSPTILLRINRPGAYMHRAFNDFARASRSAEAFATAGFSVTMHSATGQFLMSFDAVPRPTTTTTATPTATLTSPRDELTSSSTG